MKPHVKDLLPLYHDGELSPAQVRRVEQHLEECPQCAAELEDLCALQSLLKGAETPQALSSSQRFAEHVNLRLGQQVRAEEKISLGKILWNLVPWSLLGGWAFMQAISLVIMLFAAAFSLGPDVPVLDQILTFSLNTSNLGSLMSQSILGEFSLPPLLNDIASYSNILVISALLNLLIPLSFALLYLSWLAGWFIQNQKTAQNHNRS